MEIISNVALITINETTLFQLVSFLIFLWIMNRIMFKPIRETVDQREEHIDTIRNEIDSAQAELDRVTRDLDKKRNEIRQEAFLEQEKLEAAGYEKAGELENIAREKVSELRDKAMKDVAEQIQAARKGLDRESEALSIAIMEKVLERRLSS